MGPCRDRFTIRQILVLIAISALLIGLGQGAYDRYGRPTTTKTYYVGDLLPIDRRTGVSHARAAELVSEEAALLRSSVTPDAWWLGPGSITPTPLILCLSVRHTEEGHRQVEDWFRRRRERLEACNP